MYNVSQEYRKAVQNNCRACYLRGIIKTTFGDIVEFGDPDVAGGSLSINNQCVNGSDFMYGAVFSAEMTVSVQTKLDRYRFYDAEISLSYFLEVEKGRYEEIPIGVYFVEEAERNGRYVNITAYDAMSRLDREVEEDFNGSPYSLLSYIAEKCTVELSQTEEEIKTFPNGEGLLSVYASRVETYRDAVSCIASVLTGFAIMNRHGRLELRRFSAGQDAEIIRDQRSSTTISDFKTFYDAVKVRFVDGQEYKRYSLSKEMAEGGLTFDMGDIPVVQGLDTTKIEMLEKIFAELKKTVYTPFSISYNGDPAIDLGDRIVIKNINGTGEDIVSLVTHVDWKYRGKCELKAVGGNPKMKVRKDSASRQMEDLEAKIELRDVTVHSYVNARAYTLAETEKEIISINYAAVETAHPVFLAMISFTMDRDGVVAFRYYLDGVLMEDETVKQYFDRGEHFITLSNNFTVPKDKRNTLSVKACTEYFESDVRQQASKLLSIENYIKTGSYTQQETDRTPPKATIAKNTIRAVLYAQGMAGTKEWDGTIHLTDDVDRAATGWIPARKATDSTVRKLQVPTATGLADHVRRTAAGSLSVRGSSDRINTETQEDGSNA